MQMFHTGGQQQELDVLEPGEGKGVDDLDGVVVDHQHRDVLRTRKRVTLDRVDSDIAKKSVIFKFCLSILLHQEVE